MFSQIFTRIYYLPVNVDALSVLVLDNLNCILFVKSLLGFVVDRAVIMDLIGICLEFNST